MTAVQASNSGPPLLPGLIAGLCCTVRALSSCCSPSGAWVAE